jgi:hypothetical protein
VVEFCVETLRGFVLDTDQNLKYLGLVGRISAPISTEGVALSIGMQSLILKCLSDDDARIRMRVLGLLHDHAMEFGGINHAIVGTRRGRQRRVLMRFGRGNYMHVFAQ